MNKLFTIFLTAMFVKNVVLMRFLALCPFVGMSQDVKKSMGMGYAVLFVTLLATAVTYPVYRYVLAPLHLEFLQTLIFILVIASLVQLVEFYLKKAAPALYASMGVYLALITTNCAILGVAINNIKYEYDFIQSMVNSLGTGLGFMLAMYLFAGVRGYLDDCDIPENLKGLPITLVSAALVSVSFFGFKGIAEGLFL